MRKFLALCAIGLSASLAGATEIWAADGMGLIRFDSASPGAITRVGAAGVGLMQGLDFAANGTLYGFGNTGFYSFNTTTGDATFIGSPDLQDERVLDMSWNPAANRMEIVTALTSDETHRLRSVDLNTGAVTNIGNLNVNLPASLFGYAVDAAGTRFLHDGDIARMIRLDAGLSGTTLGPLGNSIGVLEGMTIHWSGDGAWYHAGFSGDNGVQELWRVNPATGAGTFLGNIGGPTYEFNFGDVAILPIPEPASLVLLALGGLVLRRR